MKFTSIVLLVVSASAKHHLQDEFKHLAKETHAGNENGLIFEREFEGVHHILENIKHKKDDSTHGSEEWKHLEKAQHKYKMFEKIILKKWKEELKGHEDIEVPETDSTELVHHLRHEFKHLAKETHADNKKGLWFESELKRVHHDLELIKHKKDDSTHGSEEWKDLEKAQHKLKKLEKHMLKEWKEELKGHEDIEVPETEAFDHVDMLTAIDATNLEDAFGCPGSDWGNKPEMHAEAKCIFDKLGHGKVLTSHEVHHALEHDCVVMGFAPEKQCPALADKYTGMLIKKFGTNGTLDEHQFYNGFKVVKGETTGHGNQISTSTCLSVAGGLTAIAGAGYLLKSKMSFNKSSVEESLL